MITRFRGEYFPFSNMFVVRNPLETTDGIEVPTSEHKYMADRFKDPAIRKVLAGVRASPEDIRPYAHGLAVKTEAYRLIEEGALTYNTDEERIANMYQAVKMKFVRNAGPAALLLSTAPQEISEGNDWEDRFWGVDPVGSNDGQNHLGKILMQVRAELPELTRI